MALIPSNMPKAELLHVLDDIRARVEAGDSWEGFIEYAFPDEDADPGSFNVRASYRIGNTMGQGGTRMFGKITEGS